MPLAYARGASLYYSPMSINSIPHRNKDELDLHHLQVLDVLLREHSLTRAAQVLNVTQPALSKTLARLRRYFDDPLFVRVALRMEPTPKALELKAPVGAILDQMRRLKQRARAVRSAGLEPHLQLLRGRRRRDQALAAAGRRCSPKQAPHVRLRAMQLEVAKSRIPGSSRARSISPWARFPSW